MKTVLISGIAGFLGSHCADHLLRSGYRVLGVDNFDGGCEANIPDGVRWWNKDITDGPAMDRLFDHMKPHAVVHCAAFASENLSNQVPLHTFRSIVMGSQNLINAAIRNDCQMFVGLSSIAIYGHEHPPFTERMIPRPRDSYGIAKLTMEQSLAVARESFGLKSIVFRPHNVAGVRQSLSDQSRNVVSIFIRQALTGQPFTVYGGGTQTRAWSDVAKVSAIIAAAVDRPDLNGRTFNVGGDRVMTVLELAQIVAKVTGVELRFDLLPRRNEAEHAHSRHEAVAEAFPGLADLPDDIEAVITQMVAEARKNPLPEVKALPPIEINKRIVESCIK